MTMAVGQPVSRVDGPAKVTGQATYAAEFALRNLAHAALVQSDIACGRVLAIDTSAAERAPGVLGVMTHLNAPRLPYRPLEKRPPVDPKAGERLHVFQGPEVLFSGQPVGLVVALSEAQARHAASLVRVSYEPGAAITDFARAEAHEPSEPSAKSGRPGTDGRGDPDRAWARAAVQVDAVYTQPREQHDPIEPHATIARWEGEELTLYDKSQWVGNVRNEIAHVFGIEPDRIRVISPFVGGAFGSALRTWPHVTMAALAARLVDRPVRLELTRRQLYQLVGFRPRTVQRVALGAARDGRLEAIIQEATAETSVYEEYTENTLVPPAMSYSCPNLRTSYRLVPLHSSTPCAMRAPGLITGNLALEMAMDELAVSLGIDPVELRLKNFAERDEKKGLPWSSNALRDCYRMGAERFGWDRRRAEPGGMKHGRDLIGWGMATAVYPAERSPAEASAQVFANGTALVRSASSDMGPGTYTSMTQIAADALGLPIDRVRFELGDTRLPTAPVHGGSITLASVGNAVHATCTELRQKIRDMAGDGATGPDEAPDYAAILRQHGLEQLEVHGKSAPGDEQKTHSSFGFGACFVEVRIDPDLMTVRVPRMVGVYDAGRVVNPKTAHSQCIGGMVGALGMALSEEVEWDRRLGRPMNANLAEYLVPVNADIGELDVTFAPSEDKIFNPLGVKGVAELGSCGVVPAIANAVWHATGRRIRELPITPERLLMG